MSVATLTDLRTMLADLLAPAEAGAPAVVAYKAESGSPPAYVVGWADPWLDTSSGSGGTGQCLYLARLEVWAVTTAIEPESGTPELEQMVSVALSRLAADYYPWRVQVAAPTRTDWGGILYFASRLTVTAEAVPNPED